MQWRYRGLDPLTAYVGAGAPPSPFPARIEALLSAFALYAAEGDETLRNVVEAFGDEAG